jgi:predicted NBD/HSP70 family sugar kinase
MPGLDPKALRHLNTSVTLRALAVESEPIGMSALAEQAGLSRRTVELILDELVTAGWVNELERVPTSGSPGRPSRRFELLAEHAVLAAVRVSTLEASAVIADVRGRILGRATSALPDYYDPVSTLDVAASLVHEALASAGATLDQLRAGALAGGGAIDENGVVRRLVYADAWVGVDLPREMAARVPVAWFADNDANLGALAEHWRGTAREHDNVVWSIFGNRTGLGILIRGVVHRGFQGGAGELVEAMPIVLESFAGRAVSYLTSPVAEERRAADAVFAAAARGDEAALAEVDAFAEHISGVLVILAWTLAPSLIVLGGGLENGAELLLPRVRESMRRARTPNIELRASALGADGPLVGALKFVLDRMDTELFGPLMPKN